MTNTTASTSPQSVTTGGIFISEIAHIDWLGFTIQLSENCDITWLANQLRTFLPLIELQSTGYGWNGYKVRLDIHQHGKNKANFGLVAYGGVNQRGTASIQLNAQGCAMIVDWILLEDWCVKHAKKITRIDLAHDDYDGVDLSINKALEWHRQGMFSHNGAREGQTAVKALLIDDLDSGEGKTFYVGRRGSGKLLRIYEKGKQLGDKLSLWTRAEVELKDKSRVIPWDALTSPSLYLAAAYPCLSYLSQKQVKIKTINKSIKTTINSSTHHLRNMGGKLINVLLQEHQGDTYKVIQLLRREGIPKKLENYAAFLSDIKKGG